MSETVSLLKQREIELKVLAPVIEAFSQELGKSQTIALLRGVIQSLAKAGGCQAAIQAGGNTLIHLQQVIETWKQGESLSLEILQADAESLEFNVTRCRFAEMYHQLGLQELGTVLSCERDAAMIEGFQPTITFRRTQTIMQGASHCDFRFQDSTDSGN